MSTHREQGGRWRNEIFGWIIESQFHSHSFGYCLYAIEWMNYCFVLLALCWISLPIVNNVGDEGVKYLSESLKVNTTLTQLDLGNVYAELSEYLSRNKQLRSMSVPDEMASFLNERYLSDVIIKCKNGEQMRAHKIVLAAMSRCAFIYLFCEPFSHLHCIPRQLTFVL